MFFETPEQEIRSPEFSTRFRKEQTFLLVSSSPVRPGALLVSVSACHPPGTACPAA